MVRVAGVSLILLLFACLAFAQNPKAGQPNPKAAQNTPKDIARTDSPYKSNRRHELVKAAGKTKGDSHEKLMPDSLQAITEANQILGHVKDQQSAREARPKLETWVKRFNALSERGARLGKPTRQQGEAFHKQNAGTLKGELIRLNHETARLSKEPYGKELVAYLQSQLGHEAPKPKKVAEVVERKP